MADDGQQNSVDSVAVLSGYRPIAQLIPSHWASQTIFANGIQQHYYRTGGNKPPLVLLHGFTVSGLCWLRVASRLEQGYDVILPDARGHGGSDGPHTGFSPELLAADVAALIGTLELAQPALLGHSMGGMTALLVAATFPGLVRAILLEDPPMRIVPTPATEQSEAFQAWYRSWLAWMQDLKTQPHAERLISAFRQLPPGTPLWPEEEYVAWVEGQARFNLDVLNLVTWSFAETNWHKNTPRVSCPILLMTGNPARGAVSDPARIQEMVAGWQEGQHSYFEQAGHMIHHEAFERYMDVVTAFLQRH